VVARGGLEVELTATELVDPEGAAALPPDRTLPAADPDGPDGRRPLVVTARRDRAVLGVAAGWTSGDVALLCDLLVTKRTEDGEDVAGHLRAAFTSEAAARGVRTFDDASHPTHQGSGDLDVSPEAHWPPQIRDAGEEA